MKEEILNNHLGDVTLSDDTLVRILSAMEEYADLCTAESGVNTLDIDRIVKMRADGRSVIYIAKFMGVSRQTIYNYIKKKSGSDELPI